MMLGLIAGLFFICQSGNIAYQSDNAVFLPQESYVVISSESCGETSKKPLVAREITPLATQDISMTKKIFEEEIAKYYKSQQKGVGKVSNGVSQSNVNYETVSPRNVSAFPSYKTEKKDTRSSTKSLPIEVTPLPRYSGPPIKLKGLQGIPETSQ